MTTNTPTNLDGIRTDIEAHRAELPTDVVDCVGCHIAINDVPALLAELEQTRALVKAARAALAAVPHPGDPESCCHAARTQALRDAFAKAIELLDAYPVPTFCAAAIETRLDEWMRDQIEGCR